MALIICLKCTTAYTVGAPGCPHCGSKKHVEQGAKGDPTLAAAPLPVAATTNEEAPNAQDL